MSTHPLLVLFCAVVIPVSQQESASKSHKPGELKIEKRSFKANSGEVIDYELGTLFVLENRSDSESRVIGVGFARFPSADQSSQSPPMFRLPGGPGGSYVSRITSARPGRMERSFPELLEARQFCDVVYVDQRGFSQHGDILRATFTPSKHPKDQILTPQDRINEFTLFARQTVDKFSKTNTDLRGYTVKECADDVAELRKALGYETIMLNGTSFGSQWSFAVMRRHPNIVTRALLSGVEPLNHGYDMPSDIFAAVQRMWRIIDEDKRFAPYLPKGGLAEAARIVIERLERVPIKLESRDSETGDMVTMGYITPMDFPWSDPRGILELYHNRTERWKQMAALRGISPRISQINLILPLIDSSLGVTPERRYRLLTDPASRYTGTGSFGPFLKTANIWPSPDVGDKFRTPVLSDIPVVFAQGNWDTQTPIENTFEIAPFFTKSRVLIAERGGHGVLNPIAREHPKVWRELVEFLRTGDMKNIPDRLTLAPSRRFEPPKFKPPSQ